MRHGREEISAHACGSERIPAKHPLIGKMLIAAGRRLTEMLTARTLQLQKKIAQLEARVAAGRREEETGIRESEPWHRSTAESPLDFIFTLDSLGNIQLINAHSALFPGDSPRNIIGRPLCDLFPSNTAEIQQHWKELHQSGTPFSFDTQFFRPGQDGWINIQLIPKVDARGKVLSILGISRDLTKHMLAEALIADQSATIQRIIDSVDSPIFSIDANYCYTNFNEAHRLIMKKLYGADIERGKSIREYQTVKEDWLKAKDNLDRALQGEQLSEEAYSGEETLTRRYFEVSHRPVMGADKKIIGVVVCARDLTERKQAENALRRSEELFRSIIENSLDAIYRLDLRTERYDFISPVIETISGYTPAEIVAMPLHEGLALIHPDDMAMVARRSGKLRLEYRIRCKDGRYRWLSDYATFMKDESGCPIYRAGVIRDITQQKQIEEKLRANQERLAEAQRESEERYQDLFANSPSAIVLHEGGVILDVNPALLSIGKFERAAELVGARILDFVHPEDRDKVAERIDQIQRQSMDTPAAEIKFLGKDGSIVYTEVTSGLCHYHGRMVVQSICRDFTERNRDEGKIRLQNAILDGINRIFRETITCATEEEWMASCLNVAGELTRSRVCFMGKVNCEGRLDSLIVSDSDGAARKMAVSSEYGTGVEAAGICGICRKVFREGEASFTNEPTPYPDFIGARGQYPPLTAFLGAPLIYDDRLIGMIGLGNREGGYRGEDLRAVEALAAAIVEAFKRKRLERYLQEREDQYRTIVELSPDMIIVHQDYQVVYINQAGVRLLGASSVADIIGGKILDRVHPDYRAEAGQRIRRIYESSLTVYRVEQKYLRMDGSAVDVEVMASHIIYHGKPASEVIVRDITERRRAAEALRESEERYRAFFENSIDAVLIISSDGAVHAANPEACRIFGMTEAELKVSGGTGVIDATVFKFTPKLADRAAMGRFKGELIFKRKDGAAFPGEVSCAAYTDRNGMLKMTMIIRDTTKRKEILKALQESEEHFRILAETLPQLVWTFDTAGNGEYYNNRVFEYTGLRRAELNGWGWLKAIHYEDIQRVGTCWDESIRNGEPYQIECRMRRRDGEYHWFLVQGIPLRDGDGEAIRWLSTCTDIHQQQQLMQKLQESNARLHQLNKKVVTTLEEERGAVSRELHDEAGQGLTALKIFLELLRDGPPLPAEASRQQLDEAVSITAATLERIRRLARDLRPPALDALGLNLSLADFCREYSRRVGLPIGYEGCDLPELSDAVSICLYRFLQEALTNVVRHARADQVQIRLDYENGKISLLVHDNGIGFEYDQTDWKLTKGSGLLGMRERLEMAGGQLIIDSHPGQGTLLGAIIPWEDGNDAGIRV